MAQYVYGKNVVRQILTDATRARKVWISVNDPEIERLCKERHVPLQFTDKKTITKMAASDKHQGVIAEIVPYQTYTVAELTQGVSGSSNVLVMLDGIEDPHNLGAILRTCDCVGAAGVIYKKDNAVGLTPAAAKTSAGAIDTVKCAEVTNLVRTCEELKKQGWWIIGADMAGQDYRSLKYDMNVVLVIGSEGKGISRLLKENCDYLVKIPMKGRISSLNASVSAAVLLYGIDAIRFPL